MPIQEQDGETVAKIRVYRFLACPVPDCKGLNRNGDRLQDINLTNKHGHVSHTFVLVNRIEVHVMQGRIYLAFVRP